MLCVYEGCVVYVRFVMYVMYVCVCYGSMRVCTRCDAMYECMICMYARCVSMNVMHVCMYVWLCMYVNVLRVLMYARCVMHVCM